MELTIYEELYQTPLRICFGVNCCTAVNCSTSLEQPSQNYNNTLNRYPLKNHQNRTVVSRTTKISQEGLEMRAQHQEAKEIRLRNENETNIPSKKSNRYYKRHSKKRPISLARL